MACPKCGGEAEYAPVETHAGYDAYTMRHAAQNAGSAAAGGHPLAALLHVGGQVAKYGIRAYRNLTPYRCTKCGSRF